MTPKLISLLIATSLSLAACAPMNGRDGHEGGGPRGGGMDSGGSAVSMLQDQLQKTADALKLTPKQTVLWDAYQDKVGALMADQMKQQFTRSISQSAPQQVAQKVEVVRNRLTAMEDIQEAANKLYAALDDKQKKVADQMLASTVPTLYSGLGSSGGSPSGERSGERSGNRGGPGGGGMGGGPGGGMGGGFGRM